MVVGVTALERYESNTLDYDITSWVGEDPFLDSVTVVEGRVAKPVSRHSRRDLRGLRAGVALFLREKVLSIRDDEAQVARACLIDTRIVNFVEDTVAQGEPHATRIAEGGADAALFALDVHRGGMPGQPGAKPSSGSAIVAVSLVPFDDDLDRVSSMCGQRFVVLVAAVPMSDHLVDMVAPSELGSTEIINRA